MKAPPTGLITGPDGLTRCWWPGSDPQYLHYHDHEWGRGVRDDFRLFEKICLEGFQAGLSWLTILRKRENFRAAFAHFDFHKVSTYTETDIARLLQDSGIIRHRGKILSTINNAQRALQLLDHFPDLHSYFRQFQPPPRKSPLTWEEARSFTFTTQSIALSKDLKKRGWTFVGPTTAYAFMQAMGLVNDHLKGCHQAP